MSCYIRHDIFIFGNNQSKAQNQRLNIAYSQKKNIKYTPFKQTGADHPKKI